MKNIILIVGILIFTLMVSCKKGGNELERDHIIKMINKISITNNTKSVIILPGLGCQGCIQEGEVFIRDHINNTKFFFVLTKIESLKILQNKLNLKIKEHSNVYVDGKEEFDIPTENRVYPCIVYIENGKIKSHEFQSPGNNAFLNLKNRLHLAE